MIAAAAAVPPKMQIVPCWRYLPSGAGRTMVSGWHDDDTSGGTRLAIASATIACVSAGTKLVVAVVVYTVVDQAYYVHGVCGVVRSLK